MYVYVPGSIGLEYRPSPLIKGHSTAAVRLHMELHSLQIGSAYGLFVIWPVCLARPSTSTYYHTTYNAN